MATEEGFRDWVLNRFGAWMYLIIFAWLYMVGMVLVASIMGGTPPEPWWGIVFGLAGFSTKLIGFAIEDRQGMAYEAMHQTIDKDQTASLAIPMLTMFLAVGGGYWTFSALLRAAGTPEGWAGVLGFVLSIGVAYWTIPAVGVVIVFVLAALLE